MKYFTKEVKIALLAIVGLILLYLGLNFLKGVNTFSDNDTYYVSLKDISGLSSSSPIYVNGYKVGIVKGIRYDYSGKKDIMVEISVDEALRIPEGSNAEIVSDMLGNVKLNIIFSESPSVMKPGSVIIGSHNAGAIGEVKDMMPLIANMLPKLDSILGNVNKLVADPAMEGTIHNVEKITSDLTSTTLQINSLLADANNKLPKIADTAGKTLSRADSVVHRVNAVDFEATVSKLDAVLEDAHKLMASLNSSESSLGLLARSPELYNNLNATIKSADSLLVNLREHPKRYVHFSIFGKKDK